MYFSVCLSVSLYIYILSLSISLYLSLSLSLSLSIYIYIYTNLKPQKTKVRNVCILNKNEKHIFSYKYFDVFTKSSVLYKYISLFLYFRMISE